MTLVEYEFRPSIDEVIKQIKDTQPKIIQIKTLTRPTIMSQTVENSRIVI